MVWTLFLYVLNVGLGIKERERRRLFVQSIPKVTATYSRGDGTSNLVKIYELTFPSFLTSMAAIGFKGGVRLHSRSPPAIDSHNTLEAVLQGNRILFIVGRLMESDPLVSFVHLTAY